MTDRRLRELERRKQAGDPEAELQLAREKCRQFGHGDKRPRKQADGSVQFYCDVCGLDFIVMGVLETFLEAGLRDAADEYMRYSSLYMEQLPDGRWRRGGPHG